MSQAVTKLNLKFTSPIYIVAYDTGLISTAVVCKTICNIHVIYKGVCND